MRRYRNLILGPLALALISLGAIFVVAMFLVQEDSLQRQFQDTLANVDRSYDTAISADAGMLRAVLRVLEERVDLQGAFEQGDRDALQAIARPLFQDLREDHRITHFYFHQPDGVNFLRVHQPERFGDIIERFTMKSAMETGGSSHGVELGPLGTFTLRVVVPLRNGNGEVIGFLELGEEIDHIITRLHEDLQVDLLVFIQKPEINRERWQEGMVMLGRRPDWDRFSDRVLVSSTREPEQTLMEAVAGAGSDGRSPLLSTGGQAFGASTFRLRDAANREVGRMAVVLDQTAQAAAARQVVFVVIGVAVLGGFALWLMFFELLRRIEARLTLVSESRDRFLDMSRRDGLTGLFNHNEFYRQLDVEVERSERYGHPLVVVLLDIDYFKRVNDTHGHQVGDEVLRAIADVIQGVIRPFDKAARYGGEEFALMVPHTTLADGFELGERLRAAVAEQNFDGADGSFSVTISVGVAAYPDNASSSKDLTRRADAALYHAKGSGRNRTMRFDDVALEA